MALNSLGRQIPQTYAGKTLIPYSDPWSLKPHAERSTRAIRRLSHNGSKLVGLLRRRRRGRAWRLARGSFGSGGLGRAGVR